MAEEGRHTEQEVVVELLEEILTEIRLRLPVKSLLRFKTACKSWYSVINSTEFIKKHLNLARAARYNQHKHFLGLLIPHEYASIPCVSYKEDSDGILHAREFDFPYIIGYDDEVAVNFCNSCDGLVCFIIPSHHRILIWNPSIPKEYKIVEFTRVSEFESAAVGYDRTSDDYKVIKVPSECSRDEVYISVEIFSLKNSSWRSKRISVTGLEYYSFSRLVYAENGLYWIATQYDKEGHETECIVYFDLAEESLDYMNTPEELSDFRGLVNCKDSIAITNSEGQEEQLWVLEDYSGMESSWKKIYSFNFEARVSFAGFSSFTLNGELLVHAGKGRLSKFDAEGCSFENVAVQGGNIIDDIVELSTCYHSFYASPYVESLVSLRQLQLVRKLVARHFIILNVVEKIVVICILLLYWINYSMLVKAFGNDNFLLGTTDLRCNM